MTSDGRTWFSLEELTRERKRKKKKGGRGGGGGGGGCVASALYDPQGNAFAMYMYIA